MDTNGNNRYQLLFTDDESMPISLPSLPSKKKLAEDGGNIKNAVKKKVSTNNEKENKSSAINKNVNKKHNQDAAVKKEKVFNMNATKDDIGGGSNNQRTEVRVDRNKPFGERSGISESDKERPLRQTKERSFNRYRNGERFGKREFDRQSGSDKTGVKAVDKREGAGAHNWGSIKQEIDDIDKANGDNDVSGIEKDDPVDTVTEQLSPGNEEEAKEMTLDEWKALRQNRSKPQYNLRKAGEGEDTSQWKKMVVLNKKKNDDSEEEYEFDPSLYPQRVGRLQRITDIKFNFNDGRRGFGRGRGRDRTSRNDNRDLEVKLPRKFNTRQPQREKNSSSLKVDDENQFPTLG